MAQYGTLPPFFHPTFFHVHYLNSSFVFQTRVRFLKPLLPNVQKIMQYTLTLYKTQNGALRRGNDAKT